MGKTNRFILFVGLFLFPIFAGITDLVARSRWSRGEPLSLEAKKHEPLSQLLLGVDRFLEVSFQTATEHKSSALLMEELPPSRTRESVASRDYLKTRIELYGLAPLEAHGTSIAISYDSRRDPIRVDFSRIWQGEVLVNGYIVTKVLDRDWATILQEDVDPFLSAQGLQGSWRPIQHSLIPTAFAFGSCTKNQVEASKNTAALTGDVVAACINPLSLAVGAGVAGAQGVWEGVKEKSPSAGLKKACENMPIIGPSYRLSQQAHPEDTSH